MSGHIIERCRLKRLQICVRDRWRGFSYPALGLIFGLTSTLSVTIMKFEHEAALAVATPHERMCTLSASSRTFRHEGLCFSG